MLVFSSIPETYIAELLRIEQWSNPHPWMPDSLLSAYRQYEHLGVFDDTKLLAFVIYHDVADEGEIIHLVCRKAHQKQGNSRALLTALCEQLAEKNIRQLFLEVREDNERAKQLYDNMGFVEVGRRIDYYPPTTDAIIMKKNIPLKIPH